MKKLLLILLALVMCISVCACGNSDSPEEICEEAVEKLIDVGIYRKINKESLLSVAPLNFWQRWADKYDNGNIEAFFAKFENATSDDKEKANNTTVKYEIKYLTQLSEDECVRVEKALEKKDEINYPEITAGFSMELLLNVADEDDTGEYEINIVVVNMEDAWYVAEYNDSRIRWWIDTFI